MNKPQTSELPLLQAVKFSEACEKLLIKIKIIGFAWQQINIRGIFLVFMHGFLYK